MQTSQRSDAHRNRDAILRVAVEAFRGEVPRVVQLQEIASRAGLGRSTVYRHFADRHALGQAVIAEHLDRLRQAVADTEACHFRELLGVVLSEQASMRPLVALIRELSTPEQKRYVIQLVEALAPAFRAAQARGEIRVDAHPMDLILLMEILETAVETQFLESDRDGAARRLTAFLLDGLFTDAGPRREDPDHEPCVVPRDGQRAPS
ncbi:MULTISPECIES: TetR/AcrR family transcriptional regulator [Pseudofrankia]|uniref:TetR/AcrR family transcriptional regulator n=1 Tax=Pseudofrankia TaxID=2994363 RepID=UPI000234DB1D|nr:MULTISPECIES: TetR/AcrR family transcriptional regulator [Pseudofrankia]OHV32833.1 hypothetical protein BCD49_28785 [Pseudofrankia sp. EUN1h]